MTSLYCIVLCCVVVLCCGVLVVQVGLGGPVIYRAYIQMSPRTEAGQGLDVALGHAAAAD